MNGGKGRSLQAIPTRHRQPLFLMCTPQDGCCSDSTHFSPHSHPQAPHEALHVAPEPAGLGAAGGRAGFSPREGTEEERGAEPLWGKRTLLGAVCGELHGSFPLFCLPLGPGLPTCLVCVCLGSSVYCDDIDLENIPPLPRMTTYLYARFNRISRIRTRDFKGLTKLKRIDLTSNFISSIDNDALRLLPALQDLILPENQLVALPLLPSGIEFLDVRLNRLRSSGIQPEAFRKLQFLYLADNQLDSIPWPLPLNLRSLHLQNNMIETMQTDTFCDPVEHRHTRRQLEDIRLDGNPINLSLFPSAYFCLPRLPIGRFT
uniref:Opticin n=1 Tax=Spermophilus dauricus TaxID=99837 RepID=A0A8C9P0F6_SPEDA